MGEFPSVGVEREKNPKQTTDIPRNIPRYFPKEYSKEESPKRRVKEVKHVFIYS